MIKVGVIGFGFMGITHAMAIQRNKKLKLQAIITRRVDAVEKKLSTQTGNLSTGEADAASILQVNRYTSLQECLKHEKLDAVHICVHTDLHYELAKEAMEYGLHVLLEKPLSLNLDEGRSLIRLATTRNVKFMVAHVVRFMPPYQKLKQWIDTLEFGPLKFLSMTRFSGVPSWGQWNEKRQEFGSSGGALFDLVIHDIDFVSYALGVPGKIQASCYPGALSMHDYISAHWFYNQAHATVEGGNVFHSQFPFQAGYMASFQHASVTYSTLQPEFIKVSTNEKLTEVPAGDAGEGYYNEIDYFATCIEEDRQPLECTPDSSLQTIQLCYDHL